MNYETERTRTITMIALNFERMKVFWSVSSSRVSVFGDAVDSIAAILFEVTADANVTSIQFESEITKRLISFHPTY